MKLFVLCYWLFFGVVVLLLLLFFCTAGDVVINQRAYPLPEHFDMLVLFCVPLFPFKTNSII